MTIATTSVSGLPRRAVLAMGLATAGLAGRAAARATGDLVDLAVIDRETGAPLQVWRHGGRAYVAGQPGARYGLRVTNNTGGRVLAVMSVDGVNIITGQTAGYDQRGYVFDPWQSYEVSGWRKSDAEIAAFNFARLSRSYAARTGRPGDVGVIGIAVFRERAAPPMVAAPAAVAESRAAGRDDASEVVVTGSRVGAGAAPAARARVEEKLGTGHGARERSVATTVAFERATASPPFVRQIEYDTYDNLAALGVIRPGPGPARRPRPFPAGGGYVPDPPGAP